MVDLIQWRISIGCFCASSSRGYRTKTIRNGRHYVRCGMLCHVILVALLCLLLHDVCSDHTCSYTRCNIHGGLVVGKVICCLSSLATI